MAITAALTAAYPDVVVLGEEAHSADPSPLERYPPPTTPSPWTPWMGPRTSSRARPTMPSWSPSRGRRDGARARVDLAAGARGGVGGRARCRVWRNGTRVVRTPIRDVSAALGATSTWGAARQATGPPTDHAPVLGLLRRGLPAPARRRLRLIIYTRSNAWDHLPAPSWSPRPVGPSGRPTARPTPAARRARPVVGRRPADICHGAAARAGGTHAVSLTWPRGIRPGEADHEGQRIEVAGSALESMFALLDRLVDDRHPLPSLGQRCSGHRPPTGRRAFRPLPQRFPAPAGGGRHQCRLVSAQQDWSPGTHSHTGLTTCTHSFAARASTMSTTSGLEVPRTPAPRPSPNPPRLARFASGHVARAVGTTIATAARAATARPTPDPQSSEENMRHAVGLRRRVLLGDVGAGALAATVGARIQRRGGGSPRGARAGPAGWR